MIKVEVKILGNRRRLRNPQNPRSALTQWAASLDGARIPGGCDPCAAYQTVHVIDHGVDQPPGLTRRLVPRAPKEAAPMTVHNRRWDCCGDRLPLVPSAIHPGEQYIAGGGLAAGATAAPAGRPLSTPPRQGRATPRPRPSHGITPTGRPSATGPPTLGAGRDTPPPLPSCRRSPRRPSATAGALRVPVLAPSLAAAPRAAGWTLPPGPQAPAHRARETEGSAHSPAAHPHQPGGTHA